MVGPNWRLVALVLRGRRVQVWWMTTRWLCRFKHYMVLWPGQIEWSNERPVPACLRCGHVKAVKR